jgi:hypothetical protein
MHWTMYRVRRKYSVFPIKYSFIDLSFVVLLTAGAQRNELHYSKKITGLNLNLIGIFLTIRTDTTTKAGTSLPNFNTTDPMSLTLLLNSPDLQCLIHQLFIL